MAYSPNKYSDIEIIDILCCQVLGDIQNCYDAYKIDSGKDCEDEALRYIDYILQNKKDLWDILECLDVDDFKLPVDEGYTTLREVAVFYAYQAVWDIIDFYAVFDELKEGKLEI